MFIRWIERPSKTPGYYDTALSLILAESTRIKGKPRQRHIAYLGGITRLGIDSPELRCYFWDGVTAAFDRLGNRVHHADRKRLETAIATRVPRPTAAEYRTAARRVAQDHGWSRLTKGFKAALANEADKWKGPRAQDRRRGSRRVG